MYKSLNGLAPVYFSNLFHKKSTRNVIQLRNTDTGTDLVMPLHKNTDRATVSK